MHEQGFSLEKYVTDWQSTHDTVTIEGTLHEDGDWYIIDPNMRGNQALLYRIRKQDVVDKCESRKMQHHGQEYQTHVAFLKKGVPVARISVVKAERLAERRASKENASKRINYLSVLPRTTLERSAKGHELGVATPLLITFPEPIASIRARSQIYQEWLFAGCDGAIGHGGPGQCVNVGGLQAWETTDLRAWRDTYGPYVRLPEGTFEFYWQIELTGQLPWPSMPGSPNIFDTPLIIDVVHDVGRSTIASYQVSVGDWNHNAQRPQGEPWGVLTANFTSRFTLGREVPDVEIRNAVSFQMGRARFIYLRIVKIG
jgi:hypothetical protein